MGERGIGGDFDASAIGLPRARQDKPALGKGPLPLTFKTEVHSRPPPPLDRSSNGYKAPKGYTRGR